MWTVQRRMTRLSKRHVTLGRAEFHDGAAALLAVSKDAGVRVNHVDGRIALQHRELRGKVIGLPKIVAIERRDVFTTRYLDTGIAGAGGSLILLPVVSDVRAIWLQHILQLECVRRTVVHDDDFVI